MIKGKFIWILSAILVIIILAILSYNENAVRISPSFQTSSMENMYLKHKEGGHVKWELSSNRAILPEGKKSVHLDTIALKINHVPEIHLTSGSGIYDIENENVILNKSVELNMKDAKFTTETLHWNSKAELINTDDDVKFIGSNFLITGSGLTAKVEKEKVRIIKDVKAIYYR